MGLYTTAFAVFQEFSRSVTWAVQPSRQLGRLEALRWAAGKEDQEAQGDVNAAQLEFTAGVTNRVWKMEILATQIKQLLKKSGSQ